MRKPISHPAARQLILSRYLIDTNQEISTALREIGVEAEAYQVETYAIDQLQRVLIYGSDWQSRTFSIYISGDYIISNTARDKEFFTVTHSKTQKFSTITAKLSDMVRRYPITSTHNSISC